MTNTPFDNLGKFDCVLIVTDHTEYDYKKIVNDAQLVVDVATPPRASSRRRSCFAS